VIDDYERSRSRSRSRSRKEMRQEGITLDFVKEEWSSLLAAWGVTGNLK